MKEGQSEGQSFVSEWHNGFKLISSSVTSCLTWPLAKPLKPSQLFSHKMNQQHFYLTRLKISFPWRHYSCIKHKKTNELYKVLNWDGSCYRELRITILPYPVCRTNSHTGIWLQSHWVLTKWHLSHPQTHQTSFTGQREETRSSVTELEKSLLPPRSRTGFSDTGPPFLVSFPTHEDRLTSCPTGKAAHYGKYQHSNKKKKSTEPLQWLEELKSEIT